MSGLLRLFELFFRRLIHEHQREHGHCRRGFLFFIAIEEGGEHKMTKTQIQAPVGSVSSIAADFAGVLAVVFLQAGDDGVVQAGKGPYSYAVNDTSGLFKFTAGAEDGSTPATLQLAGATASGSADVTATDQGTGITATATVTVTPLTPPPPPPPSGPTQGAVFFVPQAPATSGSSGNGSGDGSSSTSAEVPAAVAGHPEVSM